MSQKNKDFFKQKKEWSKTKDQLLGYYLRPYTAKIFYTRKPTCYVDCFAGQGTFEDGNPGSPIIAMDIINENLMKSKNINAKVEMYFIELNYADILEKNLTSHSSREVNYKVINGKFEENIEKVLSEKKRYNIFLYIDPYGIKAIEPDLFKKFATSDEFNSCEILINMNTFGFLREGCRIMQAQFEYDYELEKYIVEYEPSNLKSVEEMNKIAGGEYWQDIIMEYKNHKIDIYEAEKRFSKEFCDTLMDNGFNYVLNMPIYSSITNRNPKYRLIFGTNHNEGCILMADNMLKQSNEQRINNSDGQLALFDFDCNDQILNDDEIKNNLISILNHDFIRLNDALANYYVNYGIQCDSKKIIDIIKQLDELIEIKRDPEYTKQGIESRFYSDSNEKKLWLRVR